jgi:hypothetical protein
MITRTPFITVPLHQLRIGMSVVNQHRVIGKIVRLNSTSTDSAIGVDFDEHFGRTYYTSEGFMIDNPDDMDITPGQKWIKLVDEKKAVDVCANIEHPDISNNGLTTEELDTVNALVNNRGMTRAAAIMMIM